MCVCGLVLACTCSHRYVCVCRRRSPASKAAHAHTTMAAALNGANCTATPMYAVWHLGQAAHPSRWPTTTFCMHVQSLHGSGGPASTPGYPSSSGRPAYAATPQHNAAAAAAAAAASTPGPSGYLQPQPRVDGKEFFRLARCATSGGVWMQMQGVVAGQQQHSLFPSHQLRSSETGLGRAGAPDWCRYAISLRDKPSSPAECIHATAQGTLSAVMGN